MLRACMINSCLCKQLWLQAPQAQQPLLSCVPSHVVSLLPTTMALSRHGSGMMAIPQGQSAQAIALSAFRLTGFSTQRSMHFSHGPSSNTHSVDSSVCQGHMGLTQLLTLSDPPQHCKPVSLNPVFVLSGVCLQHTAGSAPWQAHLCWCWWEC